MAVQKSKKTRSRIGMRRSHDSLTSNSLATDPVSGERHLRHNMSADGFYKGRLVKDLKKKSKESEEEIQQAAPEVETPKSEKAQLQELLNSLPPEMLVNNTKRVGEE